MLRAQNPTANTVTIDIENYVEYLEDVADPAKYAGTLKTRPWSVVVDGQCGKPGTYNIEDIMKFAPLEERIYRLRCVEGWSMVIPWVGFPLAKLLQEVEPTSAAKYVRFETLFNPEEMPAQKEKWYPWPYQEGLRLDEARHDLTLLATERVLGHALDEKEQKRLVEEALSGVDFSAFQSGGNGQA